MPDDRCESRMSAPVIRRLTGGDTEYAALIADRMYDWWGKAEGYSREAVRAHIERGFNEDRLPMTFGMFLNGRLIGMYQFTYSDLFPRPDLYPWLANLFIDARFRGRGLGRKLIASVRGNALKYLEHDELFLFTAHTGLYEKYGWERIGEVDTFLEPRVQGLYRLRLGPRGREE